MQNPLGKIPVLLLDDGSAVYDSPVILEYLDLRAGGGRIIPREPSARFSALQLQALCDGILDASVLQVLEGRFRPQERHEPKWLDYQAGKVTRALAALERQPPARAAAPDVGHITLACALGYRDLRFAGSWRADHPRLVAWLDDFAAQVPAFAETKAPGVNGAVGLKPVVHAQPQDVQFQTIDAAGKGEVAVAEIDVQVFGLGRPVRREPHFHAESAGPAGMRFATRQYPRTSSRTVPSAMPSVP